MRNASIRHTAGLVRRLRVRPIQLAGVLLIASLACHRSAATAPDDGAPADRRLNGRWSEIVTIPGVSLILNLSTSGNTVTGTGTYAIEAGRSGTLTVSGIAAGSLFKLEIAFDMGTAAQLDGNLVSPDTLAGHLKYGPPESLSPTILVNFRRI